MKIHIISSNGEIPKHIKVYLEYPEGMHTEQLQTIDVTGHKVVAQGFIPFKKEEIKIEASL